jgi:hypothetical protein
MGVPGEPVDTPIQAFTGSVVFDPARLAADEPLFFPVDHRESGLCRWRVRPPVRTGTARRTRCEHPDIVEIAVEKARQAGCQWMHVDFEHHLRSVYFDACGFNPTDAGLIEL